MSDDRKIALLRLLAAHETPLIEDDIYGDLYFGAERPRPFMALNDGIGADVLYCSSFSKTLAPGYRIGWIVTRNHLDTVLAQKFSFTLCGPALSQQAMSEFLESEGYEIHLRRLRLAFSNAIEHTRRAISECFPAATRVTHPDGGFVLWVELPAGLDSRSLLAAALDRGICFVPGEIFSASGRFRDHLRLSCGSHWEEIRGGVQGLGHLVSQATRSPAILRSSKQRNST